MFDFSEPKLHFTFNSGLEFSQKNRWFCFVFNGVKNRNKYLAKRKKYLSELNWKFLFVCRKMCEQILDIRFNSGKKSIIKMFWIAFTLFWKSMSRWKIDICFCISREKSSNRNPDSQCTNVLLSVHCFQFDRNQWIRGQTGVNKALIESLVF